MFKCPQCKYLHVRYFLNFTKNTSDLEIPHTMPWTIIQAHKGSTFIISMSWFSSKSTYTERIENNISISFSTNNVDKSEMTEVLFLLVLYNA